jgi:hypothetical protein
MSATFVLPLMSFFWLVGLMGLYLRSRIRR